MADAKKIVGGLGKVSERLLSSGDELTAAQRADAGRKAAQLIKAQEQVKASEALGQLMEKGVKRTTTTQADRTRVGGGNIGGASFPAISQADPAYAGKVWGVMDEGTAARLKNLTTPDTAWTTMLGSANQLKTNPIVFDKLKRGFVDSMKQGNLSDELAGKINHNLALTFGEGADIRDPKIWREANTFEKRAALADVMMGQGTAPSKGGIAIGGEKSGKGVIFKPTDILKRETEPSLLHTEHGGDVPTFAAGPRLFRLDKESEFNPSLHPGFPTLLKGEDYGINMKPTPTEVYLPDWHKKFKKDNPERKGPGYYDLALGVKGEGLPSQELNDEYIRHLLREGFKKGGSVDINAADQRLQAAIEKRMAKGGSVDIEAADARLADAIAKRTGMAEGGGAFKKIQFMADGGKLVKGIAQVGKKLLESGEEAPKVDRLSMNFKDVTKRVPEVAEAIEKLNRGEITKAQYNDIVNLYKPVTPYSFVPKPASKEEAVDALRGDAAKERYGKQSEYEAGSKVGLRLDIPAYTGKGVWVNSIHNEKAKKVAYGPVASVKNADLGISQAESKRIALGGAKAPYARIKGEWNPVSEEEAIAKAQEYLNHPEWRQIGMDPERHSYFYDRATMQPITNAEEVIQIGPLVLGKNPKYGKIDDFEYADGGKIVKGGLNIARRLFKTSDGYTFKELPDGRVTNGDMTWNSAKEFMAENPHAFQQGDELGQRRANMESFGRPDPQNIPADISKFMPDDAYAQFLRAYNKQNAPKPQLSVVPTEKKADGGKLVKGATKLGKRLLLGETLPAAESEENLRKMLDSSKIKERLYHATPEDVKFFKPGGLNPKMSGEAIWLSNDPRRTPAAHNIGTYDNPKSGVNVMPVHVQAKNPMMLDDEGMLKWAREVYAEGSPEFPYLMPKKWRDEVMKDYDSIVLADPYKRGDSHEIIMFEPEKIKSAIGNRGTYNTDTADITKAEGGAAFKTIQWKEPQHFDGGGMAVDLSEPSEGSRREPLLTKKDWENVKRNAPAVYDWAKQNVKDEANQLKSVKGAKDFALRTGAQYLGGIPDLVNLGLMGVDAVADTSLSSEKPWFGSEQYIDALHKAGALGENEFPIAETVAGVLAPAGLIKKGIKKVRGVRPVREEPKKRRGGLTAMSR